MDFDLDPTVLETLSMRDEIFLVFEDTGDIDLLESVIAMTADVLEQIPPSHPQHLQCTLSLFRFWDLKFQTTDILTDLHEAIRYAEETIEALPPGHSERTYRLGHFSHLLHTRYQRTEFMHDLDQAISCTQQALASRPPPPPQDLVVLLNSAHNLSVTRFGRTGALGDMHSVVFHARDLMQAIGSQSHVWANLSNVLGGGIADRERAIVGAKRMLARMADRDPGRAGAFGALATAYYQKYQQTEAKDELRLAISYATRAAEATPPDHPERAGRDGNLKTLLDWRHRLDPAMHDIGIVMDETVLAREPGKIKLLGDLVTKLSWRFEQLHDPDDEARADAYKADALAALPEEQRAEFLSGVEHGLELRCQSAVSYAQVLLEFLPEEHPERGPIVVDLADTLFMQYMQTEDLEKLQLAISTNEDACAHPGPDQIRQLNNLSTLWYTRYGQTRELQDLEQAILCSAKSVAAITPDHTMYLVILNNHAAKVRLKYDVTDDLQDLQQALSCAEMVLAAVPSGHVLRADTLAMMGDLMAAKYHRTQNVDDMRQVVPYAKEALMYTPEGHPDRAYRLNDLARKYYWRYKQTALVGDIRLAAVLDEQALQESDRQEGAPSRALYLSNLAAIKHSAYQRSGNIDEISAAILLCKEALVTRASPRDPIRARYLVQLARYLEHRYQQIGDTDDVRQSVSYGEEALKELPHDHPARVHLLATLSRGLSVLHKEAGDEGSAGPPPVQDDSAVRGLLLKPESIPIKISPEQPAQTRISAIEQLQQAISYSTESLEATPLGHPERSARLQLHETLESRYQEIVTIPDLQQSLLHDEEALAAAPPPHADRHRLLGNLLRSVSLLPPALQKQLPIAKLNDYIRHAREWRAVRAGDSTASKHSAPLASLFFTRYLKTKDIADLDQAIVYNKEAIAGTALDDHPRRRAFLILQAVTTFHRYHHNSDLTDLDRAISYAEDILQKMPVATGSVSSSVGDSAPDSGPWLDQHGFLADCYWVRYERARDTNDLDRAIQHREQALAETPPGRILAVKAQLNGLSQNLGSRYEHTGQISDLNRAIKCAEEAYDSPSVQRATNLYRLSSMRFDRSGDPTDLEGSIKYARLALDAAPGGKEHYTRAGCLANLASAFQRRFEHFSEIEDLTYAIDLSEEVLEAVPEDHVNRAGHLQNMVGLLGLLYERTGSEGGLERGVVYSEQALASTRDPQLRAGILINLGDILKTKYLLTCDTDTLQQAILYAEEALTVFPQDHLGYGIASLDLAHRYQFRAEATGSASDMTKSVVAYKEAWGCSHLIPDQRVRAARGAADILISRPGGAMEAYSLLKGAIGLLPELSPRSLGSDELMSTMNGLHGLAADAASAALEAGMPAADALTLLELSRGIITGMAIDYRSDLSELSETDRALFNRFNNLRVEIDTPLQEWMAVHYRVPKADAIRRRREGVDKMAALIAEIRTLPGHEGFQLPLSPTRLMSMAEDGAIVTFSSSALRSDAIIVTSTVITSIPLPKLSFTELGVRMAGGAIAKLSSGTLRTYAARNNQLRELLGWLWEVAVWPVLQHLQFTAKADSDAADLPHICWVGTGLLSVAPFHAAGDYARNADPLQNTMSYVVSSYTPTIKALSYAREKDLRFLDDENRSESRMLLVTMPVTPGESDLPDVEREVESIRLVTEGSILSTHRAQPSATRVLVDFETYGVMHLACHGISDAVSPSNSHLILLSDGAADRLNIARISRRNAATSTELVYLSACSTAQSTGVQFADESLHIASGFQLAGFSHVLAAMWSAESRVCVDVSTEFYRSLFDGRGTGHRKVRTAFHEAVRKAQVQHRRSPLKWAPFIHMGA